MSLCFRYRDVQLTANLLQVDRVDPSVHHGVTAWTDADQIPQPFSGSLVIHHVTGRCSGFSAFKAVDLSWLACTCVLLSLLAQKRGQLPTQNENGSQVINDRQTLLNPLSYRVLVNAIEVGDLFHGVIAMNLGEPRILASFPHHPTPVQLLVEWAVSDRFIGCSGGSLEFDPLATLGFLPRSSRPLVHRGK